MTSTNPLPTPHGSTATQIDSNALPGFQPSPGQQHGSGTQSASLDFAQHAYNNNAHNTNNNNNNSSSWWSGNPANGGAYYGAPYSPMHHTPVANAYGAPLISPAAPFAPQQQGFHQGLFPPSAAQGSTAAHGNPYMQQQYDSTPHELANATAEAERLRNQLLAERRASDRVRASFEQELVRARAEAEAAAAGLEAARLTADNARLEAELKLARARSTPSTKSRFSSGRGLSGDDDDEECTSCRDRHRG